MDLHHLKHFVATAEELNFGRAAARLHIVQPALSRSIQRLEEAVGTPLFKRTRQHVELTEAGAVLLVEAREILAHAQLALQLAQKAGSGEDSRLRVGFIQSALFEVLPKLIRLLRDGHPLIEVSLKERFNKSQIEGLREGKFDIGFVNMPVTDRKGLAFRVVERSRYVAAMPAAWPLARHKKIHLAELKNAPFIMIPPEGTPTIYQALMAACHGAGFTPNVVQEAEQTHGLLRLVAAGLGVALVVDTAHAIAGEGVAFVPIDDLPDSLYREIAAVWLPRAISKPLAAMLDIIEAECRVAA